MGTATDGQTGTRSAQRRVSEQRDGVSLTAGADSVMLARAAERNPSIFLPAGPRCNLTEIVPKFLNICEYIDNPWGNTKFLLAQFRASAAPISTLTKQQKKDAAEAVTRSKSLPEVAEKLNITLGGGKEILDEIQAVISRRTASDVFEERHEAVAAGPAVDEPVELEAKSQVDGFEVGVGSATAPPEATADEPRPA